MDASADFVNGDAAVAAARNFAQACIEPVSARWERERRLPREAFTAAAEQGLCGLLVPPALGGAGLGVSAMAGVMEALAYADMGFAFALVCHNNLAGAIAKNGTGYHRSQYLHQMLDASAVGGFLLTEPGVGSDATAIMTTAVPSGDGWVLNGEMAWVTNGTEADLVVIYAQTVPGSGAPGIAAFLLPTTQPGVIRGPA